MRFPWWSTIVLGAACTVPPTGLSVQSQVNLPPGLEGRTVVADISFSAGATGRRGPNAAPWSATTHASLLGNEAFRVDVDEIARSETGRFQSGRVCVTLQLRIVSTLNGTIMRAPTYPAPPDSIAGIYLFPVRVTPLASPEGVITRRNGIEVSVAGSGSAEASVDWDGRPYDYFRSSFSTCTQPQTACARYERFAVPLAPLGASEWRRVGFDVNPAVRGVRVLLVLAADLANAS